MKKWFAVLALSMLLLGGCARQTGAELSIHFFEAGKADAILIQTPQSAVLVDAGLDKNADLLANKLSALGVNALDAMIITHFDKDHVGGADVILRALPVKKVYQPFYYKDSKQYRQYAELLEQSGIQTETLTENTFFSLDGADYALDTANQADYGPDEENDFSLVTRLTFGETSALLAGDAEEARLGELMEEGGLKSDLIKMPHHGRYNRNTLAFVEQVKPGWAVITSAEDQPEDEETLRALAQAGARVYMTRQGDICLVSDGRTWREG